MRQTSLKRSSLKRTPAATGRRRLDEDCPWQKHVVTLRSDLWRTEVKLCLPVGLLNQKATTHLPRREELATHHHADFWLVSSQLHKLFQDSMVSTLFASM